MQKRSNFRELLLTIALILCLITIATWGLSTRRVIAGEFAAGAATWQVALVDGCILAIGTKSPSAGTNLHESVAIRNTGSLGLVMPEAGRGAPPVDYYGRLPLWLVMIVLVPVTVQLWRRPRAPVVVRKCLACGEPLPAAVDVCLACGRRNKPNSESGQPEQEAGNETDKAE